MVGNVKIDQQHPFDVNVTKISKSCPCQHVSNINVKEFNLSTVFCFDKVKLLEKNWFLGMFLLAYWEQTIKSEDYNVCLSSGIHKKLPRLNYTWDRTELWLNTFSSVSLFPDSNEHFFLNCTFLVIQNRLAVNERLTGNHISFISLKKHENMKQWSEPWLKKWKLQKTEFLALFPLEDRFN